MCQPPIVASARHAAANCTPRERSDIPADFTAALGWAGDPLGSDPDVSVQPESDRCGGLGLTPFQNRTLILMSVRFSGTRRAGMRPSEPVEQVPRGLVWRRSIERHQR